MHSTRPRTRRRALLAVLALAVGALTVVPAAPAVAAPSRPEKVGPPNSMAALGDSITRAFNASGWFLDYPSHSWSAGHGGSVFSVYRRILAVHPAISGNQYNHAVTGAKSIDLANQAQDAVNSNAELVTVLIGANDVCTSTEAGMTTAATYRARVKAGLDTISEGLPDARIFVVSIPNIHRLWEVGHVSASARTAWNTYNICQSMLENPASTAIADVERRERVRQHVVALNAELESLCAEYIHCRFDDNTAFGIDFVQSDLSGWDYFHPNVDGQDMAAANIWGAFFDFSDVIAPVTTVTPDRAPDGVEGWYGAAVTLTLSATDANSAVSGSEYDLRPAGQGGDLSWTRYEDPLTVEGEGATEFTVRSVDVNGNIEASTTRTVRIDTVAPEVAASCPAGHIVQGASASASVVATDVGSGLYVDPSGEATLDTSTAGSFQFEAIAEDRAGNTTSASCGYDVIGAPVVTYMKPTAGLTSGGTQVTITGSGFTGVTAVRFGSTAAASFEVLDDATIEAVSPPRPVGLVNVWIENAAGTNTSQSVTWFNYQDPPGDAPVVSSITPNIGTIDGGTVVTIKGTGFLSATNVRFGPSDQATFTVLTDTTIEAVSPPRVESLVNVWVTNPNGTSSSSMRSWYSYREITGPPPTVSSVSPKAGSIAGGETVTITGTGFTDVNQVRFGHTDAVDFVVHDDTSITATTPARPAGWVNVWIISQNGKNESKLDSWYKFESS